MRTKKAHKLRVRKIVIGLSLVLSVAGFCAVSYREFVIGGFGYQNDPPYLFAGVLLIVIGATLFVIALVSGDRFAKKEKIETHLR